VEVVVVEKQTTQEAYLLAMLVLLTTDPKERARTRSAGGQGYICRECIATCMHAIAERDTGWRDELIQSIARTQAAKKNSERPDRDS
jgi:hypothetical protein